MNIKKHITAILTSLLYIDIFTKSEGLLVIKSSSETMPTDSEQKLDSFEKPEKNTVFYRDDTTDKEQKTITRFLDKIANTGSLIQQNILNNMLQRADVSIINYVIANYIFDIDMNHFSEFQEQLSLSSSQRPITTVASQKTPPPVLSESREQSKPISSQTPVATVDSQNTPPPVLDKKQSASKIDTYINNKTAIGSLLVIIFLPVLIGYFYFEKITYFYSKTKRCSLPAEDSENSAADKQNNNTFSPVVEGNLAHQDLQRLNVNEENLLSTTTSSQSTTTESHRPPTPAELTEYMPVVLPHRGAVMIDETPRRSSTRTNNHHPLHLPGVSVASQNSRGTPSENSSPPGSISSEVTRHLPPTVESSQSAPRVRLPHAVASAMIDETPRRSSTRTNNHHPLHLPGVSVASQNSRETLSQNSEISPHICSNRF